MAGCAPIWKGTPKRTSLTFASILAPSKMVQSLLCAKQIPEPARPNLWSCRWAIASLHLRNLKSASNSDNTVFTPSKHSTPSTHFRLQRKCLGPSQTGDAVWHVIASTQAKPMHTIPDIMIERFFGHATKREGRRINDFNLKHSLLQSDAGHEFASKPAKLEKEQLALWM